MDIRADIYYLSKELLFEKKAIKHLLDSRNYKCLWTFQSLQFWRSNSFRPGNFGWQDPDVRSADKTVIG